MPGVFPPRDLNGDLSSYYSGPSTPALQMTAQTRHNSTTTETRHVYCQITNQPPPLHPLRHQDQHSRKHNDRHKHTEHHVLARRRRRRSRPHRRLQRRRRSAERVSRICGCFVGWLVGWSLECGVCAHVVYVARWWWRGGSWIGEGEGEGCEEQCEDEVVHSVCAVRVGGVGGLW